LSTGTPIRLAMSILFFWEACCQRQSYTFATADRPPHEEYLLGSPCFQEEPLSCSIFKQGRSKVLELIRLPDRYSQQLRLRLMSYHAKILSLGYLSCIPRFGRADMVQITVHTHTLVAHQTRRFSKRYKSHFHLEDDQVQTRSSHPPWTERCNSER
jgi:hypothetical protein